MGLIDFSLGDIGNVLVSAREAITGKKIEDPEEQAKIALQLEQLDQAINTGQIAINKAEAKNPSIFVAGWRPFIGWVGGVAIAYNFIAYPLFGYFGSIYHLDLSNVPTLDMGVLFNLILAMLGFGGMRTYEKLKNVQDRH